MEDTDLLKDPSVRGDNSLEDGAGNRTALVGSGDGLCALDIRIPDIMPSILSNNVSSKSASLPSTTPSRAFTFRIHLGEQANLKGFGRSSIERSFANSIAFSLILSSVIVTPSLMQYQAHVPRLSSRSS